MQTLYTVLKCAGGVLLLSLGASYFICRLFALTPRDDRDGTEE